MQRSSSTIIKILPQVKSNKLFRSIPKMNNAKMNHGINDHSTSFSVRNFSTEHVEGDLSKYGGMMGRNWDELWQNNQIPWDTKQGCPILRHLVESVYNNRVDIKHGLIPGCGNGYDADLMSGIKSIETVSGLDISENAVNSAERKKDSFSYGDVSKVSFICGDFFKVDKKFDIIFDYTFLCALPIPMREMWAKQMKNLLNSEENPQSELVTLIFPLFKQNKTGQLETDPTVGPPYLLNYALVENLLTQQGFTLVEQYPVPPQLSHPARVNNEIIARWKLVH